MTALFVFTIATTADITDKSYSNGLLLKRIIQMIEPLLHATQDEPMSSNSMIGSEAVWRDMPGWSNLESYLCRVGGSLERYLGLEAGLFWVRRL